MKNENNDTINEDPGTKPISICDDNNILPANLLNPLDKTYEKPEKLQNRIKLIETIKEKIDNEKLYICLDIEAFERNHDFLTEFGWCLFKKNGEIIKKKHAIVEEYISYHNGRYVPDNKNNYNFGKSEVVKLKDIYKELKNDFDQVNYLVGHGINNDIRFLKKIKVDVSKFKKMNGNSNKIDDYGIIETMDLFSGFFLTKPVGLEKSLRRLEIPYKSLHNAGNDAYYTMQVFLEIIKRFDFFKEPKYEQVMNYKPPKKMKSNNNRNNKANNSPANNNNNTNFISSNNSSVSDSNQSSNESLSDSSTNNNSNSNHQNNGNNKTHNKNNRSNNANTNNNNNENGSGNDTKIVAKRNSQRRKFHRNLKNRKSFIKSNNNNNNYNNNIINKV
ncbi:hypothetical protein H8356DRAFT_304832 [Neocallimastix lanati (nom. inval.)]|jgi:hypothetical protein|uniref:Gfd2/YDR514C-like C-terminal domain-containing protein n=1 Tax=Neocallimastix californiae TaxID=1754190 RepID=A0A1Y2DCN5_9FUNG|nr:hypothetical protein H8356DRAFT_304832 [Neocallimastix sp. JGI-2020a]ORY57030.1 hypothetical protein LY90DRAFT_701692 [Neocallimastix californiae]|eukprot:ORY57030.1 hypothetical protein LY90DRAFT_701692 [Neocallimastix californiae]